MENVTSGKDGENRPQSAESKESEIDINLPVDTEIDDDLDEDYAFMTLTQEEQSKWEAMIQKLKGELQERGKDFSDWTDKITRRRMFAYTRMKKLEKGHQRRIEFYNNVDDFLDTYEDAVTKIKETRMKRRPNLKSNTGMQAGRMNAGGIDSDLVKTPVITKQPPTVST